MKCFGGITGIKGVGDIEALRAMRGAMRIFAGEDWRADLYGGTSFLFGGFEQPMELCRDGGTRAALMLLGSLSNKEELCELYSASERESDAGVFLKGYMTEGIGILIRARGSFAVSVYDSRAGRVLLYRSPMAGERIFYRADGKRTVFATAFSALRAVDGIGEILELGGGEALIIEENGGECRPSAVALNDK